MRSAASAPGKVILFGEHAVVYGKPAVAVAINRRTTVTLEDSGEMRIDIPSLGISFTGESGTPAGGILDYIMRALELYHDGSPLRVRVDMEVPAGSGLGSSAALTVALIGALDAYHGREAGPDDTASRAHRVELGVQGAASPLDTAVSTYGGLIYLAPDRTVRRLSADLRDSLVISSTHRSGNTAEMVASVRERYERLPEVMSMIMDATEMITRTACRFILENNLEPLGELMNINHGLLDAMGVSTPELSMMVHEARAAGAAGAKITGAGGGGSIVAFCPGTAGSVAEALGRKWNTLRAEFSSEGVLHL